MSLPHHPDSFLLPDGQLHHRFHHDIYHYYAMDVDSAVDPHDVAHVLGLEYMGPIGDLEYHMYRIRKEEDDIDGRIQTLREHASKRLVSRAAQIVNGIVSVEKQTRKRRLYRRGIIPGKDIAQTLRIWDPGFHQQWHLKNEDTPGNDLNVTGVWLEGITGKGVTVCIVDDGLDYESQDLHDNFFADGSYDFNDHVALPKPMLAEDIHGTRCAGEIAAVRNNVCGVGVAYDARISGIRILSGDLTESDEALSLYYGSKYNEIYSCSWGPPDDGKAMDAPSDIVKRAFRRGIERGRDGKGILYVFASGNGGGYDDNWYTNSLYTMTIGAIDRANKHPYYSENCSALFASAYSSGSGGYIFTTDVGSSKCATTHGGTSAAAPLVSGIYALILQIRPDITWRDAQHILVETAIPFNTNDPEWQPVAKGRIYNHQYGFGKVDAYKMVEHAKTFKNVNPQVWVQLGPASVHARIPSNDNAGINSTITVTAEHIQRTQMKRLEHVTITVNIAHDRRGDVEVRLVSPSNIVSVLAPGREYDESKEGFRDWTFLTVVHWNDDPLGVWTLNLRDRINRRYTGSLIDWTMRLWGEAMDEVKEPTPLPPDMPSDKKESPESPSKITRPRPVVNGTGSDIGKKVDSEAKKDKVVPTLPSVPITSMPAIPTMTTPAQSAGIAEPTVIYGPLPKDGSADNHAAIPLANPSSPQNSNLASYAVVGAVAIVSVFVALFIISQRRRFQRPGYEFHRLGALGDRQRSAAVSSKELLEAFGEDNMSGYSTSEDGEGELLFENELMAEVEQGRQSWEDFSHVVKD